MGDGKCSWEDCEEPQGSFHSVDGQSYCPEHYVEKHKRKFLKELKQWGGNSEPRDNFKYTFARYVEELYKQRDRSMPGGLSKGRLQHRTEDFEETEGRLCFSIERHPYAWTRGKKTRTVEERWCLNLPEEKLQFERRKPITPLTTEQAAEELDKSVSTITRWIRQGKLEAEEETEQASLTSPPVTRYLIPRESIENLE